MILRFAIAWLFALCFPLLALGQSVRLPTEVQGGVDAWIVVAPESVDGGKPKWRIDPGLQEVRLDLLLPPEMISQLKGKVVTGKQGRYRVESWNAKDDVASDISTCWVVIGTPGPIVLPTVPTTPTTPTVPTPTPGQALIILLHEAEHGPLPPYAIGTARELVEAGRSARLADDDELTGLGEIPKWLKPALEPGRAIMGASQIDDALVVLDGERVVKAIKLPATREAILEAVK